MQHAVVFIQLVATFTTGSQMKLPLPARCRPKSKRTCNERWKFIKGATYVSYPAVTCRCRTPLTSHLCHPINGGAKGTRVRCAFGTSEKHSEGRGRSRKHFCAKVKARNRPEPIRVSQNALSRPSWRTTVGLTRWLHAGCPRVHSSSLFVAKTFVL